MNMTLELYGKEIKDIKTLIKSQLGFMPKASLPTDIQEEVYSNGWGRPDLIPTWEDELAHPRTTYRNPFGGGECPIDPEWIEARKAELQGFIDYNKDRKQIPLDLDKKLDWLIQRQIDCEEESPYYTEEEVIAMRIGLPDDPTDVPDWWYERG